MTVFHDKDTEEQFFARACREYTLTRKDESSQPKGWIQGSSRIGPVLEITTSNLYGKHGIEIRIWSLSEDNDQTWVRISHGSNKFVIDSNYNNTEVPADLPEEQTSQSSVKVFAARSKAKAKPQKREPAYLPSIIPMNERKWIDIEPEESSLCVRDFEESNPSSSTLSNGTTRRRRSSSILENQECSSKSISTNPRDKGHQDPAKIDLTVPRRAQYLHSAWKKHQDALFWVDINIAIQKGLTFYQTRSNAIILQGTLPAYCIPKVVRLKTGEVIFEKSYVSPRPPPKISLKNHHDWTRGKVQLGSTVDQRPEGKVVRQSRGENSTRNVLPTNPTNP